MDNEQELLIAWEQAYSIPPGGRTPGKYIGNVEKNGRIYEFYKETDGKYFYKSRGKNEEIEKTPKRRRYNGFATY